MTTTHNIRDPAYTARLIREAIASNYHFIELRNIPQEWSLYQKWRATQTTLDPKYQTWPQLWASLRYQQLLAYRDELNKRAVQTANDPALSAALQGYANAANALSGVYMTGVDPTIADPQDLDTFRTSLARMITAQYDTSLVRNIDDLPTNAAEPIFPAPRPPPQSIWSQWTNPNFVGAKDQIATAKANGFFFKRFDSIHTSIPDPGPTPSANTTTTNTGSTRNRRGGGGGGGGGNTTHPPSNLSPYSVQSEIDSNPQPARIDFRDFGYERHPEDYNDEYFIHNYKLLYDRVVDFAEKWFGDIDLGSTYVGSPWQEDWNTQFIEYSRLVAHEDRHLGGWPAFLREAKYRKWLVVGIIGQIIQKKIFSELLFGANDDWKDELNSEDFRLIDVEGYRRKARRSETVKMALKGMFVPAWFWGDVDELTWRSSIIFEQLINLLDLYRPQDENQTDLRHFYQELHMIFSVAGYLQVCMAVSPSVFHHLSATPGARMDYPIEAQAEVALYRDSKETNEQLEAQWEEAQDLLAQNLPVALDRQKFEDMYPIPLPAGVGGSTLTKAEYEQAKRTAAHHRLRGARIKIAVFPMLKRYTPENRGTRVDPDKPVDETNWYLVEGQRVSDIFRCTVIYYQGLMYPANILDDGVPLDTHLTSVKGGKVRIKTQLSLYAWAGIAMLTWFLLLPFLNYWWLCITQGRQQADAWVGQHYIWMFSPFTRNFYAFKHEFETSGKDLRRVLCRAFCTYIYTQCTCD